MNLFKKLCKENQQWKYAFFTKKLHELTREHVKQRKAARTAAVAAHVLNKGQYYPQRKNQLDFAICQDLILPLRRHPRSCIKNFA
jgi:hypothetical protein